MNYRKLATDIVAACNKNKKTNQSVVLKAITDHMGFRSIQAADAASNKVLPENKAIEGNVDVLSLISEDDIAKLKDTLDAIDHLNALNHYQPFDISQLELYFIEDITEFDNPDNEYHGDQLFSIIGGAIRDYKAGNHDAFSIAHWVYDNNANGQDIFSTVLCFKHKTDTLKLTVHTMECHSDWEGYTYEREHQEVQLNDETLDTDLASEMEDADGNFFSAACIGDIFIPDTPSDDKAASTKILKNNLHLIKALA